jgi:hypothetical protein
MYTSKIMDRPPAAASMAMPAIAPIDWLPHEVPGIEVEVGVVMDGFENEGGLTGRVKLVRCEDLHTWNIMLSLGASEVVVKVLSIKGRDKGIPNGWSFSWESIATRERESPENRCVESLLVISQCVSLLSLIDVKR